MAYSSFRTKLSIFRYHFTHWLFSWRLDSEGDLGMLIANTLFLVKYKEHTIISWLNPFKTHELRLAPKHGGSFDCTAHFNSKTSMLHFTNLNREFSMHLEGLCWPESCHARSEGLRYFGFDECDEKFISSSLKPRCIKDVEKNIAVAVHISHHINTVYVNQFVRIIMDRFKAVHDHSTVLPTHN